MQPVRCMVWNSGRGLDLSGELTLKAQGKGGERKRELVEAAIEVGRQPGASGVPEPRRGEFIDCEGGETTCIKYCWQVCKMRTKK